jgi:hypothetical protein
MRAHERGFLRDGPNFLVVVVHRVVSCVGFENLRWRRGRRYVTQQGVICAPSQNQEGEDNGTKTRTKKGRICIRDGSRDGGDHPSNHGVGGPRLGCADPVNDLRASTFGFVLKAHIGNIAVGHDAPARGALCQVPARCWQRGVGALNYVLDRARATNP